MRSEKEIQERIADLHKEIELSKASEFGELEQRRKFGMMELEWVLSGGKKEDDLCFSPHCEHNKVSPGTEKERCAWGDYTKDCSDFVCGKPSVGHYGGTPMCVEHLPKEEFNPVKATIVRGTFMGGLKFEGSPKEKCGAFMGDYPEEGTRWCELSKNHSGEHSAYPEKMVSSTLKKVGITHNDYCHETGGVNCICNQWGSRAPEQKFESHRACCFLMKSMGACILQRGHLGSHKDSLGGKEEVESPDWPKQITLRFSGLPPFYPFTIISEGGMKCTSSVGDGKITLKAWVGEEPAAPKEKCECFFYGCHKEATNPDRENNWYCFDHILPSDRKEVSREEKSKEQTCEEFWEDKKYECACEGGYQAIPIADAYEGLSIAREAWAKEASVNRPSWVCGFCPGKFFDRWELIEHWKVCTEKPKQGDSD